MGLLHFACSVFRGFFRIICSLLLGGSLVEGAKKIKVAELLANMPDPTQDEVRGEGEEGERKPAETALPTEDLTDLRTLSEESDLLSDIFGLDLKREGGQYKLIPHNPNAGLSDLLSTPSVAPMPEAQEKVQVIILFICVVCFSSFSYVKYSLETKLASIPVWLLLHFLGNHI